MLYDCISVANSSKTATANAQPNGGSGTSTSNGSNTSAAASSSTTGSLDYDSEALLVAYQKLYALSILVTLTAALNATPPAATNLLSRLSTAPPAQDLPNSKSFLETLVTQERNALDSLGGGGDDRLIEDLPTLPAIIPIDASLDSTINTLAVQKQYSESSDDEPYEPLEPLATPSATHTMHIGLINSSQDPNPAGNSTEGKLISLASRLYFQTVPAASAWQDGSLLDACGQCLTALRKHPSFLQLLPAAGAVCGLLHDRIIANPQDVEIGLHAIIKGLALQDSSGGSQAQITATTLDLSNAASKAAAVLGLGVIGSLSNRLPQGPSRRKLWSQIQDLWLPIAAIMLEICESQRSKRGRRAKTASTKLVESSKEENEEAEERHAVALAACIVAFYVTEAPPAVKVKQITDGLLGTGTFRCLILAFVHSGKIQLLEPLRQAMLVCCAASPELLSWAQAVPGFSASWQGPEFQKGGPFVRYAAVYAALLNQPAGDALLADMLTASKEQVSSEGISSLHSTLLLMNAVHEAARGRNERLWGPATDLALQHASSELRSMDFGETVVRDGDNLENDFGKDGVGSEEHVAQLERRRAKLLQPECLRLIKGLRAKPGTAGKAD